MRLDPVERILTGRLPRVVVGHLVRSPPSLSAISLEEGEDRLTGRESEREIGRHAGDEVLRLMMNHQVYVAKADAQQALKHRLGEGRQSLGVDLQRSLAFRRLDRVARG